MNDFMASLSGDKRVHGRFSEQQQQLPKVTARDCRDEQLTEARRGRGVGTWCVMLILDTHVPVGASYCLRYGGLSDRLSQQIEAISTLGLKYSRSRATRY